MIYVTWDTADKNHSVSVRQSGGIRYSSKTNRIESIDDQKKIMTHCGRIVPKNHIAFETANPHGFSSDYCGSCNNKNNKE